MLKRCKEQTRHNPWFKELPLKRQKDLIYSSGERASFEYNFQTQTFSEEPSLVIKKTREGDLNIKAAHKVTDAEQAMRSDLRVSFNTETPVPAVVRKPHKSMRIKERTTFEF